LFAKRVCRIDRPVQDKGIEVYPSFFLKGISAQPPLQIGMIPAVAVVIEPAVDMKFLA
jgi:hypothetical protein